MYEMKLVLATVLSHFQLRLLIGVLCFRYAGALIVPPLVACKWFYEESIKGRGEELAIKDNKPPFSSKEVLIL